MPEFFKVAQDNVQVQANRALSFFDMAPSKLKRQRFQKRLDFYHGIQEQYLKEDITKNYKHPDRLNLQLEYDNITKFLTKELAAVYNEAPIRKVEEGTEQDQEIFDHIWDRSQIDLMMQEANRMTKLCKTVIIKVSWRDETIQYDIITPNLFEALPMVDDQTKADAFIYASIYDTENDSEYLNNDRTKTKEDKFDSQDAIFYYWTNENFIGFKRDVRGGKKARISFNDKNEDFVNPYGLKPFVVMRDEFPTTGFYIQGGDELINKNGIINQKLTEKNYLTKQQSFSNLVRKGAPSGAAGLISDPSMTLDVPADTEMSKGNDIKYITPDAKIEELTKDIEGKKRQVAIDAKLNPDIFTASAERSSAQSLQLQNAQQAQIVKADKPFYMEYEQNLFDITRIVWNTHNNKKISDKATLFVDYKDSEMIMTVKEEDEHMIILDTNNLISKVDWIMKINPDLNTREAAMQRLIEISEEKADLMKLMIPTMPEMELDNDADTEATKPTDSKVK